MPGRKEDLRNAQASDNPDLNFSYNELLSELKQQYGLAEKQAGDITPDDVAAATGHRIEHCRKILKLKAKEGVLQQVRIRGSDGKIRVAYRKVVG